jgi:2-polyprenyl-3-methyl-5-hydroxy-6-metoxy-1,4-benzoquinol methylase
MTQQGATQIFEKLHEAYLDLIPNVAQIVAADEQMGGAQNPRHYFGVGQSALRLVKLGLLAGGKSLDSVRSILDFPCGHGRVLRTLHAAFPRARLTASDLLREGVAFCVDAFGATPVYSQPMPTVDIFPDAGNYDLIFVGSLMTHLDSPHWPHFLGLFEALLAPEGLLIVTTHGPFVAYRLQHGETYGYQDAHAPKDTRPWTAADGAALAGAANHGILHLLRQYQQTGFGYLDDGSGCYGITRATPVWTLQQCERLQSLRVATYLERGWDNHQDAVMLSKRPFVTPDLSVNHPFL